MKKTLFKFISLMLAITLLNQNVIWSAPSNTPSAISHQPLADLYIPEQCGRIDRLANSELLMANGKKVILIKDAHCHYEAQRNIAKILDILIKDYGIDLIGVEGACSKVDPSVIAGSSDIKKRKEVANSSSLYQSFSHLFVGSL